MRAPTFTSYSTNTKESSMLSTEAELKPLTEETIANLRAVAKDPIDAMRLAADLYATNAYLAERALAIEAGKPWPKPPKPLSRYVRSFTTEFEARLGELAKQLKPEELARLGEMATASVENSESNGGGLMLTLLLLTTMHPKDAMRWIRFNLSDLEAGSAS